MTNEASITVKIPDEFVKAAEQFNNVVEQFQKGLVDIRKVKRYLRRFRKAHLKWVYNL